jgi:Protein of unknown function (DUF1549)/Protein of unknown function (DUF1553)/Planctomycete cytochrome C
MRLVCRSASSKKTSTIFRSTLDTWMAICFLTLCSAVFAQEAALPVPSAQQLEFFEREVRPLLVERCFECHGGLKAAGGLSLQSARAWMKGGESGPAIVPGKPEESLLIDAIRYKGLEMPPADQGGQLSPDEIEVLVKWVAMGAADPRDGSDTLGGMSREEAAAWWAFQPLPNIALSHPHQIDALIQREWSARGLTAAPLADKRTLLRRASYDLTGLPPTEDEMAAFLADEAPQAFARVVDRLLASPQYGVQWGRHWLDVVRYADTAGENTDRPLPHAWRYRNWVIESFNRDLPFDQFVQMQIAGDLLGKEQPQAQQAEGIIATGYLAIARRFGHDIDKDMYLTHEDVIDNLGKNFLGLTLGCARCHDHKYDPISAEDYYALYGIFDSSRFAFPGCEPKGQPRDLVALLPQSEIDALLNPWRERQEQLKQVADRRTQFARQVFPLESEQATRVLQHQVVKEGSTVDITAATLAVRQGEVLLLTIEPGGNHGADSTLVQLDIQESGGPRRWSSTDCVKNLTASNPLIADQSAWCFIETTKDGPVFLTEKGESIEGNSSLKKWSLGDTPSVFVNSSDQPVKVWTTLPANSLFVHPGPSRPVTIAWISPIDGEISVQGRVADAHPAGLDGVAFRLTHVARAETGVALRELGGLQNEVVNQEPAPVIPVAYAVIDREAKNAHLQERGDPEKLGKEVPRRWLSILGGHPLNNPAESGRRELATWVTTSPLMARVMVNRIWEWHFGRGLVRSSNDFGARGDKPTHPDLLDQLASRFAQSGYSLKSMHRLLMLSETYQRASLSATAEDSQNSWLAHFNRRRLTAEELRDSLLFVSGQIDLSSAEAHPFPAEATWTFSQHAPFNAVYENNHRSVYMMVQRQRRHPFLALFDGADPNASTPTRQTTSVPTQALYFMNSPFFHSQAASLAAKLESLANDDARILSAWGCIFQRQPTPTEAQRCQTFLATYPADQVDKGAALVRVLLASNEFVHVD